MHELWNEIRYYRSGEICFFNHADNPYTHVYHTLLPFVGQTFNLSAYAIFLAVYSLVDNINHSM